MSAVFSPFRSVYRYLQTQAHEKPAVFYSLVVGAAGPVLVFTVPPIRTKYFGWKPAEKVPTTYPMPNRPREQITGYDDE